VPSTLACLIAAVASALRGASPAQQARKAEKELAALEKTQKEAAHAG